MLKYILFDLDETLYPRANGLMQAIADRMRLYIMNQYGLSAPDASALQEYYWKEYGTTLRGLYLERQIEPREYLQFVHDVPLGEFIAADEKLRAVLASIPQEKIILTNADQAHAQRTLEILGIADQFTHIFDTVFFEYECKPARGVYERALQALSARGSECVLVEDMARNLPPARELGIKTILVSPIDAHAADVSIENIYQVADAIERLDSRELPL